MGRKPKVAKKKKVSKKDKPDTKKCHNCDSSFDGVLPHSCRYCGQLVCSEHLLPESHECDGLQRPRSFAEVRLKKDKQTHKKKTDDKRKKLRRSNPKDKKSKTRSMNGNTKRDKKKKAKEKQDSKIPKTHHFYLKHLFLIFLLLFFVGIAGYILTNQPFEEVEELEDKSDILFHEINQLRQENGARKIKKNPELSEILAEIVQKQAKENRFPEEYDAFRYLSRKMAQDYGSSLLRFVKINFTTQKSLHSSLYSDFYLLQDIIQENYKEGGIKCYGSHCLIFFYTKNLAHKEEPKESDLEKTEDVEISQPRDAKRSERFEKYRTKGKTIAPYKIGSFSVYKGVNDYLADLPRSISYYSDPPTTKDFILRDLDNEIQSYYLEEFVQEIIQAEENNEKRAKLAIRLVQTISYDWEALESLDRKSRYPYEVLYDYKGVCADKSNLLIYLLRELGYGAAVFEFESENHRAVGVKCDLSACDYHDSGYCFIESTSPTIPTYANADYVGVGKLGEPSEIITISEGESLDLSEECKDAIRWTSINNKGPVLNRKDYKRWDDLVEKYGIKTR